MDSFEQAVKKAKDVFDVACKKTGEVVSLQKLKFKLASLENELKHSYEKLGEMQYNTINKNELPEGELLDIINIIDSKKAEIETLRATIEEAKFKKICPNCSASISEDAVFCSVCGAKQEK